MTRWGSQVRLLHRPYIQRPFLKGRSLFLLVVCRSRREIAPDASDSMSAHPVERAWQRARLAARCARAISPARSPETGRRRAEGDSCTAHTDSDRSSRNGRCFSMPRAGVEGFERRPGRDSMSALGGRRHGCQSETSRTDLSENPGPERARRMRASGGRLRISSKPLVLVHARPASASMRTPAGEPGRPEGAAGPSILD